MRLTGAGCAALTCAVAMAGCAVVPVQTPGTDVASALAGRVHGGQQPVANATVTLYAAGNSGYGT